MAWQARNDDRHGHDAATRTTAATRQAVREIQQLYEMKDEVLPEFQYILDQPIETVLQLKANLMRCWINTYKSILTKRSPDCRLTIGGAWSPWEIFYNKPNPPTSTNHQL